LGRLGVLEPLVQGLDDPELRLFVCFGLAKAQDKAKAVLPKLKDLYKSASGLMARRLLATMCSIDPDDTTWLDAVVLYLKKEQSEPSGRDPSMMIDGRTEMFRELRLLGSRAIKVLPIVKRMASNETPQIRYQALLTLPLLDLGDPTWLVRWAAFITDGSIDGRLRYDLVLTCQATPLRPKAGEMVPFLVKVLDDPNLQNAAIMALGAIGRDAASAVPRLVDILQPKARLEEKDPIVGPKLLMLGYALKNIGSPLALAALRTNNLALDMRFVKDVRDNVEHDRYYWEFRQRFGEYR